MIVDIENFKKLCGNNLAPFDFLMRNRDSRKDIGTTITVTPEVFRDARKMRGDVIKTGQPTVSPEHTIELKEILRPLSPKPLEKWPRLWRQVLTVRHPGETGIGDTIHRIITNSGVGPLYQILHVAFSGKKCAKCQLNQQRMNELYPYTKLPNAHTTPNN